MRRLFDAPLSEGRPPVDEIPGEITSLEAEFPSWYFGVKWLTAASGPDARVLIAWRDGVTLTAHDADGLRRKIRETGH